MATNTLSYSIASTDGNGTVLPNNNMGYGPYASKNDAVSALAGLFSKNQTKIPVGITVAIIEENGIKEYWLKNTLTANITASDLVEKNDSPVIITNNGNTVLIGNIQLTVQETSE